ncbi:hypothetical protein QH494_03655 [Sphingomonas sp. AR_OL41]|uniref:hypothetical protein n=1 Tax=Sphingomonas sp. AR_OL41 TaxID=3042729 RepID=UPI00247FCC1C|nr:hypothetical protein [Sphingomonas sp. AR_OL41]MDH7971265.1 hypothetical protein [Sphingomonas sp. AR_OL41]
MNRVLKSLLGLFHMFGGLALYWTVLLAFGVRAAIVVAVLFVVMEGGWRLMTRRSFPPLWLFANGAALVFGAIDLWARTPFMVRYEGAILNLMTAGAFALGALGPEPLVLKFARQRKPDIPADRPEVIRFFRAFTLAWALYFVARAGAFLWIMSAFPLVQALAIRTAVAWTSIAVMLLVSLNGRRVFSACQRFGLFKPAREQDA